MRTWYSTTLTPTKAPCVEASLGDRQDLLKTWDQNGTINSQADRCAGREAPQTGTLRRYSDGAASISAVAARTKQLGFLLVNAMKKERATGLGSIDSVTLADARVLAARCRQTVQRGEDPRG
jgi:hypothetical protein